MTQESRLHLRQTQRFIDENPTEALVTRSKKVSDGMGGWTWEHPSPLSPQIVRKVARTQLSSVTTRVTADGRTVVPTFIVIAMPDQDFLVGDDIAMDGLQYEAVYISRNPEWRISVEVVEQGAGHG